MNDKQSWCKHSWALTVLEHSIVETCKHCKLEHVYNFGPDCTFRTVEPTLIDRKDMPEIPHVMAPPTKFRFNLENIKPFYPSKPVNYSDLEHGVETIKPVIITEAQLERLIEYENSQWLC